MGAFLSPPRRRHLGAGDCWPNRLHCLLACSREGSSSLHPPTTTCPTSLWAKPRPFSSGSPPNSALARAAPINPAPPRLLAPISPARAPASNSCSSRSSSSVTGWILEHHHCVLRLLEIDFAPHKHLLYSEPGEKTEGEIDRAGVREGGKTEKRRKMQKRSLRAARSRG